MTASLRAVVAVFANRNLARLLLAWGAVSFSTWAFVIGLGVYAFEAGGPAAVGIAGLVRLLPGALASPFAGLLGDRRSRRAVLLWSTIAAGSAIAGAALGVSLGAGTAVVFALAAVVTVASAPYVPAEGALLPAAARTPQELSAANVAHSTMDNAGFLAGSILAGVLLALTSPEAVFAMAALMAGVAAISLAGVSRDRRSAPVGADATDVLRETALGIRTLLAHPGLRLVGATLTVLVFFEGAADVLVVIVALDLLGLGQASVGYLNAAWGIGALLGGAALAMLLDRGSLSAGLVVGSVVTGIATALPGAWPVAVAAFAAWLGVGFGYTFVDVAGRTLMQRLGSDEVLARVLGFLEASRLAAMALGSIAAPALVAVLGTRGAVLAVAAVLPLFAAARWAALRSFEIGAPVAERPYALLRANSIFASLPVATLERLSLDVSPVEARPGEEIITEGDYGDRFYLIDRGEVEVFERGVPRRVQREGDSFGEIALLRDIPRTATVRSLGGTSLFALDRPHFVAAVTGNQRSRQTADTIIERRLADR